MASMIGGIVAVSLGAIMLASVFLNSIHGTNTDAFSTPELNLWNILGVVGIIGLVVGTMSVFGVI